jgi:hypothetical protein
MHDATLQRTFDHGVHDFDRGAFFEAHEHWELLWLDAVGDEKRWLQGLIQIAAAFVHYERGFHATGFVKLMSEGWAKTRDYAGDTWGLDMPAVRAAMQPWREHARRVGEGADLREGAPPHLPRMREPRTDDERRSGLPS